MSKRRVNNNFKKWLLKSLPFFLILFFIFFNVPFFIFNSLTYEKKSRSFYMVPGQKIPGQTTFHFAISQRDKEYMENALEVYKIENGDFPLIIKDARGLSKNKNWVYTRSSDRYILEYKP